MKPNLKYLSPLVLITLLAAGCGGGGGSSSSGGSTPTPPDSPLAPGGPGLVIDQVETPQGGSATASFVSALAINDGNQVIGFVESTPGAPFTAVLWTVNDAGSATATPAALSPLPGNTFNAAFSIDDDGNAVGQSAKDAQLVAVVWPSGSTAPTELPALAPGNSAAYGISPDGKLIVGETTDSAGRVRAVLWRADDSGNFASDPLVLPVNIFAKGGVLSRFSSAASVNNDGWIAGEVEDGEGVFHAALWRPSAGGTYTATDLRRGGEKSSSAFGINALGLVIGESEDKDGVFVPALWQDDGEGEYKRTELAANGGVSAINSTGRIAGWETSGSTDQATIWAGGGKTALFTTQSQAFGINDDNLVVGRNGNTGFVKKIN